MLRSAFPALHMQVEDVVAEGDKVAIRLSVHGTHTGPGAFFGIPPSGKLFEIRQMRLARFTAGQMTDSWAVIDMPGWMQQLGAAPARRSGSGKALIR